MGRVRLKYRNRAENDVDGSFGLGRVFAIHQIVGLQFPDQVVVQIVKAEFDLDPPVEFKILLV